ncbi:MAG TPA: nucleoside triphosphate pyrophosphohydrolase [Anaerolineae bacterium]|nr:nucleoside triphosphate pyrophosphohydrolase [Anaerolineae bacterium]
MALITLVGLGPGDLRLLTREAWDVLTGADEVYLRTARHPAVSGLPASLRIHSFDAIYEQKDDFAQVYETIAAQVVALGRRPEGVIYAMPGHPRVGEATVSRILELAEAEGLQVRSVAGLSFVEPALDALGIDALDGLQVADAIDVAARHHPPLDPDRAVLLAQLYSRAVASDVKLTLMNQYPPEHTVKLVHAAGTADARVVTLSLAEMDRRDDPSASLRAGFAHLTALYVPPLPRTGGFSSFQDTIAHLRAPDGCPWDREQTHQSLRPYLLEEAHEVLEAIDADDMEALREELGDLLLQVVLQTQIATDAEAFRMADVIAGINEKIIRRHPHVFGDVDVAGVDDVKRNWEAIKVAEREESDKPSRESILDGIAKGLPALAQAEMYGARAARVGFDWPDVSGVLDKVAEELREIADARDLETREAEFGDLLFSLVNAARWLEIDPESALRAANARWSARFREVERAARAQGRAVSELSLDEMERLWQAAKLALRSPRPNPRRGQVERGASP